MLTILGTGYCSGSGPDVRYFWSGVNALWVVTMLVTVQESGPGVRYYWSGVNALWVVTMLNTVQESGPGVQRVHHGGQGEEEAVQDRARSSRDPGEKNKEDNPYQEDNPDPGG